MGEVDPGEGYRLLIDGEVMPEEKEFFHDNGKWVESRCWTGVTFDSKQFRPCRVKIEVTTSGPYVAIEVHRAALKEIDRLQWELRDSKVWWKKEIELLKALLEAVKQPQPEPAEDPDEWVTQDRVPVRVGIDEFKYGRDNWSLAVEADNFTSRAVHGWGTLQVRCRRRDLPPMPEQKPKTETVVFHEVIRTAEDNFGNEEWVLQWTSDPFPPDIKTGRTETREVVR